MSALLEGRNQAAADHFHGFINETDPEDLNLKNAHYLSAMISYNRRDYARAIDHFEASFRLSPKEQPDWQSKIYVGELSYFLRRPRDVLEKAFSDVEEALRLSEASPALAFIKATLYLKGGNCYVDTLDLEPKESNPLVNTALALSLYKRARSSLPKHVEPDSLLPVATRGSRPRLYAGAPTFGATSTAPSQSGPAPSASRARISELQRFLLVNCVETYLQLFERDAAEYERLVQRAENKEAIAMEMTWADRMIHKGRLEERAEAVENLREVVLHQLAQRFGPLPEKARRRVERLRTQRSLRRIAERVLVAKSLRDLGLS